MTSVTPSTIYSAFGLGLAASAPIPRLGGAASSPRADVRIELRARPDWIAGTEPDRVWYRSVYRDDATGEHLFTVWQTENGGFRWRYLGGVEFFIDRFGTEIWVDWTDGLTIDDASSYLLGPVMGFVLRLRGFVCLHGSGVVVDGRALAMVGPAGAGKSTTAAAFAARGLAVLSDDVVPLAEQAGRFTAIPGYPRFRLWPSALEAVAALDASIPALPPDWGDRRFHLDICGHGYRFQHEALPLAAIYVLGERRGGESAPSIEPIGGRAILHTLFANSYASGLLDRRMREEDFGVLGRLAERVPMRSVRAHADPRRLGRLCDAILADFSAIAAAPEEDLVAAR